MKTLNYFSPIIVFAAALLTAFSGNVHAQTIDIGPNQYAFQFTSNPNYGLFFNSSAQQYQFRNGSANAVFSIDANNGNMASDLQFNSGSDFYVAPNRYAFRSSQSPNVGLYATNTRIQFLNSSASPIFSINASDGRFDTDLEFMNNKALKVAPGNFAVRSAANANAGLFFGNSEYEFRSTGGNVVFRVNASNGDTDLGGTLTTSDGSSTQWSQAHAWGDHSAAGYIDAESDPKISNDLETSDVPSWNGSQLVSTVLKAGNNSATITGSPLNLPIGSPAGNLLRLENPGAPGFGGQTSESRLAFSKQGTVIGRIATFDNNIRFEATEGGNIALRAGNVDRMTLLPNGNVGLGLTDPDHRLHVSGTIRATSGSYAIRGTKTGSGTFPGVWGETESNSSGASGVRGFVTSTTPGANSAGVYGHNFSTTSSGIGVRGIHDGTGWGVYGESNGGRGVYGNSLSTSSGTTHGVYGSASGSGGTRIGVYGSASGGTINWAGYFAGNTHITGDLRLGVFTGASGYKLSVNGKAICNEMRVQLTSNWPDYVFDESYEKLSLDELEVFIRTNKHLPNVPSAEELETQGGVDLGEMQRLTIEKVEELTLYLLEIKEANDALSAENEALRTRIEALEK